MVAKLTKSDMESWLITDGRGIRIVGEYTNSRTKTTFECVHGHRWTVRPKDIKNGSGCPTCADTKLTKLDMESWLVADLRGIKIIGEYNNITTKTTFECAHGHQWEAAPCAVKRGSGCPTCSVEAKTLTKADIESWLLKDNRGIKIIGEYTNTHTNTTFECEHGHQWEAAPYAVKRGSGCPSCATYGFNPKLPAWEYVFTRGTYLKYGITNNLNQRSLTHKRHGELELVHVKRHDIGQNALDWENRIKQTFGGKYVTDAICPDGHTETLPISHLKLLQEEKLIDEKRKVR